MPISVRRAFSARRNETRRWTLIVRGPDLTGKLVRMQVRNAPDVPGAPLFQLLSGVAADAEGFRLVGSPLEGGIHVNTFEAVISDATMSDAAKVPYSGELGDDGKLYYGIEIDGALRLHGEFWALASPIDSEAAPSSRPVSYGGVRRGPEPADSIDLTIAGSEVIEVTIDGSAELGRLLAAAEAMVADAQAVANDPDVATIAADITGPDTIGTVAADLALGGASLIARAPQAALDADADRIAAEAARVGADDATALTLVYRNQAQQSAASIVALPTESGFDFGFVVQEADGLGDRLIAGWSRETETWTWLGKGFGVPAGSIVDAALSASLLSRMVVTTPEEAGVAAAQTTLDADGLGESMATIVRDLRVDGHEIVAANANYLVERYADSATGATMLRTVRRGFGADAQGVARGQGRRTVLQLGGGHPDNVRLTADDLVVFENRARLVKRNQLRVVQAWGGVLSGTDASRPANAGSNLEVLGDSTFQNLNTGGETISAKLRLRLGARWQVFDGGISSQKSDDIAMRVGAIPTLISVQGGTIPTSGDVGLTACDTAAASIMSDRGARSVSPGETQSGPLARTGNATLNGTVFGQACQLFTTVGGVYGVRQIGGTAPIVVPAGTPFAIARGEIESWHRLVGVGRNNLSEPLQVRADRLAIARMFGALDRVCLFEGVLNTNTEGTGTATLNAIRALDNASAAELGDCFLDKYKFARGDAPYNGVTLALVVNADGSLTYPSFGAYAAAAGRPLDANDLADIAGGLTPRLYRTLTPGGTVDPLHPGYLANDASAALAILMLQYKGVTI